MSLSDVWHKIRGTPDKDKPVPASSVIPRLRESSGVLPIIPEAEPQVAKPREPNSAIVQETKPAVKPEPKTQPELFPGHYRALCADLAKRGEDIANWELHEARDVGANERGHTVRFTMQKHGSSTITQVELTMFKGTLSKIRVN